MSHDGVVTAEMPVLGANAGTCQDLCTRAMVASASLEVSP